MATDYPTIGQGADTKVLVPLADWKAIQAKLRKEELAEGFTESYREAKDKQNAGALMVESLIIFLDIYDKSDQSTVSEKERDTLIKGIEK